MQKKRIDNTTPGEMMKAWRAVSWVSFAGNDMSSSEWEYVGPHDIHDGTILSVRQEGGRLDVAIRSYEGREFTIRFLNARDIRSRECVGMRLYSLSRKKTDEASGLYAFANWFDEDDEEEEGAHLRSLELAADGFEEIPGRPPAKP